MSICAHMEKECIGVQCQKNSISSTEVLHFIPAVIVLTVIQFYISMLCQQLNNQHWFLFLIPESNWI